MLILLAKKKSKKICAELNSLGRRLVLESFFFFFGTYQARPDLIAARLSSKFWRLIVAAEGER